MQRYRTICSGPAPECFSFSDWFWVSSDNCPELSKFNADNSLYYKVEDGLLVTKDGKEIVLAPYIDTFLETDKTYTINEKYDSLYISFHKEPMITQSDSWGSWYSGYDFCINGMDMVEFLYYCDYNKEDKKILMDAFEDKIDYYNKKFIDDLTYTYVSKSILPWVNWNVW